MAEKKNANVVERDENKQKALEMALQKIEKSYGKGAVMRLGQNFNMNIDDTSLYIKNLFNIIDKDAPEKQKNKFELPKFMLTKENNNVST